MWHREIVNPLRVRLKVDMGSRVCPLTLWLDAIVNQLLDLLHGDVDDGIFFVRHLFDPIFLERSNLVSMSTIVITILTNDILSSFYGM